MSHSEDLEEALANLTKVLGKVVINEIQKRAVREVKQVIIKDSENLGAFLKEAEKSENEIGTLFKYYMEDEERLYIHKIMPIEESIQRNLFSSTPNGTYWEKGVMIYG